MPGRLAQAAGVGKRRKRSRWTQQPSPDFLCSMMCSPTPVSTALPSRNTPSTPLLHKGMLHPHSPYPLINHIISKDNSPIPNDQKPYLYTSEVLAPPLVVPTTTNHLPPHLRRLIGSFPLTAPSMWTVSSTSMASPLKIIMLVPNYQQSYSH